MYTSSQAVALAATHGCAVFLSGGKIRIVSVLGKISLEGKEWFQKNKEKLVEALRPENEFEVEQALSAGAMEETRRLYQLFYNIQPATVPENERKALAWAAAWCGENGDWPYWPD